MIDKDTSGTQSVGRAVELLRSVALQGRRGMRIDEIVQVTNLSKTTCLRILARLEVEGLIEKNARTKRFFLGQQLYELGLLAQPRYRLSEICHEFVETLAVKTQDTAYLSERSGLDAVCTDCVLGEYPIKVVPHDCGIRRPLGVAIGGTAILASMEAAAAQNVIQTIGMRYERYDGLSQQEVSQRVMASHSRGYTVGPSFGAPSATSISIGFRAFNSFAAISITALTTRMMGVRQEQIVSWLNEAIEGINGKLQGLATLPQGPDDDL